MPGGAAVPRRPTERGSLVVRDDAARRVAQRSRSSIPGGRDISTSVAWRARGGRSRRRAARRRRRVPRSRGRATSATRSGHSAGQSQRASSHRFCDTADRASASGNSTRAMRSGTIKPPRIAAPKEMTPERTSPSPSSPQSCCRHGGWRSRRRRTSHSRPSGLRTCSTAPVSARRAAALSGTAVSRCLAPGHGLRLGGRTGECLPASETRKEGRCPDRSHG